MIRLLVADDHAVVQSGIKMLVAGEPDLSLVGEVRTLASLLQAAETVECDVIILDLAFPDGNGLDVLPGLRERLPHVPVVVFTSRLQAAEECIGAGAAGFVGKDAPIAELKTAVRVVTNGRLFVTPAVRGAAAETNRRSAPVAHKTLSGRELDVMLKLARGMRPKEIAFQLGISDKTVATYRARIMKKLQVTDTRGLLLYALRAGLTDWY